MPYVTGTLPTQTPTPMPGAQHIDGMKQILHRLVAAAQRELRDADSRRDLAFYGLFGSAESSRPERSRQA